MKPRLLRLNWLSVTSLITTNSPFQFNDLESTISPLKFYRAIPGMRGVSRSFDPGIVTKRGDRH